MYESELYSTKGSPRSSKTTAGSRSFTVDLDYPSLDHHLSLEDKAQIALLDPSLIQDWTMMKIAEYTNRGSSVNNPNRIYALRSVHNNVALINRKMPPEVLIEVFSHLEPTSGHSWTRLRVIHVCHLWRSLLFRTSAFWAQLLAEPQHLLDTETEDARLELYLHLSRTRPLLFRTSAFWAQFHPKPLDLLDTEKEDFARLELYLHLSRTRPLNLDLYGLLSSSL